MMTGSIFQDFATWLNSISGTSAEKKWNVSGTYNIYCKINVFNVSNISPDLPVNNTKSTLTMFDESKK